MVTSPLSPSMANLHGVAARPPPPLFFHLFCTFTRLSACSVLPYHCPGLGKRFMHRRDLLRRWDGGQTPLNLLDEGDDVEKCFDD